jgi:MFS family permease
MGIISSGVGIGILVCVPSVQYIISRTGWRVAYRAMAILIPLVIISMAIAFLKRPPQTLESDGREKAVKPVVKDPLIVDEEWASRSWTVQQAIATKQFWFLGLSFFIGSTMTQSILTHQVAFFADQGLEIQVASYLVGLVGIVSVGAKILWGALSDRIGREETFTIGISCLIVGTISLVLFGLYRSSGLPYLYAFFFGMGYAVNASLPPLVAADFFEGKTYGGIFGSLMMLMSMGAAFGAWFAGFLFDQLGSYLPLFGLVILLFCPLAGFNFWKAAPRKIRVVPGKRPKLPSPVLS